MTLHMTMITSYIYLSLCLVLRKHQHHFHRKWSEADFCIRSFLLSVKSTLSLFERYSFSHLGSFVFFFPWLLLSYNNGCVNLAAVNIKNFFKEVKLVVLWFCSVMLEQVNISSSGCCSHCTRWWWRCTLPGGLSFLPCASLVCLQMVRFFFF